MTDRGGPRPLVEVQHVTKAFDPARPVLRDTTFALHRGEVVSLSGESGSGKSTLLSLLAGLAEADGGHIGFDGEPLTGMSDDRRAHLRAHRIGIVLQTGNLIPFLTAAENIDVARSFGAHAMPARGADLLDELGVGARRDHLPRRMSGGEAQRAAVAVALANDPDLLLADEVTGQLDSATANEVMTSIVEASSRRGLTVLYVTHNEELAARADRRLTLRAGRVEER